MKTRTRFTHRIDMWDDAGDDIFEHPRASTISRLPTNCELIINLTTAKAPGVPVADKLLAVAEEVIDKSAQNHSCRMALPIDNRVGRHVRMWHFATSEGAGANRGMPQPDASE
jgi:hypothetical protein